MVPLREGYSCEDDSSPRRVFLEMILSSRWVVLTHSRAARSSCHRQLLHGRGILACPCITITQGFSGWFCVACTPSPPSAVSKRRYVLIFCEATTRSQRELRPNCGALPPIYTGVDICFSGFLRYLLLHRTHPPRARSRRWHASSYTLERGPGVCSRRLLAAHSVRMILGTAQLLRRFFFSFR